MFMQATVLEVQWDRLLVLDHATRQQVLVNTPNARQFRPGDLVRIRYSGAMTNSIPPQIFALHITVLSGPTFPGPVFPGPVFPGPVFPGVVLPWFRPGCRHCR